MVSFKSIQCTSAASRLPDQGHADSEAAVCSAGAEMHGALQGDHWDPTYNRKRYEPGTDLKLTLLCSICTFEHLPDKPIEISHFNIPWTFKYIHFVLLLLSQTVKMWLTEVPRSVAYTMWNQTRWTRSFLCTVKLTALDAAGLCSKGYVYWVDTNFAWLILNQ